MSRTGSEPTIPPPLEALGGWSCADWFCPSVVSDGEVVGFTLPEMPGRRKQSFRIVERLLNDRTAKERRKKPADRQTTPAVTGMAPALAELGATSVAVFRRTTLLFESSAVLYFANIPADRLKARSAKRLRKDLLESRFRGCVLRIEGGLVTAMFWPSAEVGITGFVSAAMPPYALHVDFDKAEAGHEDRRREPNARIKGRRSADAAQDGSEPRAGRRRDAQERQGLHLERQALLAEVAALRAQIDRLSDSQSAFGAMETLGLDDARLKSMLALLHPDRHANSQAANDAAKWINNLRELLKIKRA